MSRTVKGSKVIEYDYWSRRPHSSSGFGPIVKQMTHRVERRINKDVVRSELNNHYEDC